MITLREIGPRAVELASEGEITPADVRQALDDVAAIRARWPKFDMLADVRGHVTFGWSALAAEAGRLPTVLGLIGALDRVALVADEAWIKRAGKVEGKLLFTLDYRTFDRELYPAARAWVLREE